MSDITQTLPQPALNSGLAAFILWGSRGPSILSNMLKRSDSEVREILSEGSLVLTIFDPNTPNQTQLLQELEDAGWLDFATEIYFAMSFEIDEGTDWASISQDADLMEVFWAMPNKRNIMLSSLQIISILAEAEPAMTMLLANTDALLQAAQTARSANTLANTVFSRDKIIADLASWTIAVRGFNFAEQFCGNDGNWNIITSDSNSEALIMAMIDSEQAMISVGNNNMRCLSYIAADSTLAAYTRASTAAHIGLAQCESILQVRNFNFTGSNPAVFVTDMIWLISVTFGHSAGGAIEFTDSVGALIGEPATISWLRQSWNGPRHDVNSFGNNTTVRRVLTSGSFSPGESSRITTSSYIPC